MGSRGKGLAQQPPKIKTAGSAGCLLFIGVRNKMVIRFTVQEIYKPPGLQVGEVLMRSFGFYGGARCHLKSDWESAARGRLGLGALPQHRLESLPLSALFFDSQVTPISVPRLPDWSNLRIERL